MRGYLPSSVGRFVLALLSISALSLAPGQTRAQDVPGAAATSAVQSWKSGESQPRAGDGIWADGKWWVTAYVGQMSSNDISRTVTRAEPKWVPNYIAAASLARELFSIGAHLRIEGEIIGAIHVGKDEDFQSVSAVLVARWITFPWDNVVDTSFAFGLGPSYATRIIKYERRDSGGGGSRWLNAVTAEFTFAAPARPDWAFVARLHHRSGIFGLIDDVSSDYFAIGMKHRF